MLGIYSTLKHFYNKESIEKFIDNLKWFDIEKVFLLTKDTHSKVMYPSNIAPHDPHASQFFGEVVDALNSEGIGVHSWLCLFEESLEDPSPIVKNNPDIVLVNKNGKSNFEEPTWSDVDLKYSTLWVCPSSDIYINYLQDIIREVSRMYRLDGIHFDYVRYPEAVEGRYYCYCKRCLQKFKEEYGFSFPTREVIEIKYFVSILTENVTNAVRSLSEVSKSLGHKVSAYVFTDYVTAIESCYQDWPYFSRYFDFLVPTLYEVSPNYAHQLIRRARLIASKDCKIEPAIYANTVVRRSMKGGKRWEQKRNAEYMLSLIRAVLESGGDGIAFFLYDTLFNPDLPNGFPRQELLKLRKGLNELGI
ncbi:MAG: hypothetical protein B6U94_02135 [Thermofilum sp. ex4484_79]|nr:MAG: hypothetical protein B6U94_02135 [Thermofilum sp. ex4484_79]